MRGGLGPSSTPLSPKRCGLVGGELMVPPPLAYNGLTNLDFRSLFFEQIS